jgi:hypothetical protein
MLNAEVMGETIERGKRREERRGKREYRAAGRRESERGDE